MVGFLVLVAVSGAVAIGRSADMIFPLPLEMNTFEGQCQITDETVILLPGHPTEEDTSDLLGWYEIAYEDGFIETVPIRYGVNILDVSTGPRDKDIWEEGKTGAPQNIYSYRADPVDCSSGETSLSFFAYEWVNPRFGKIITSVALRASFSYTDCFGNTIPANAVFLLALNCIEKRPIPTKSINK